MFQTFVSLTCGFKVIRIWQFLHLGPFKFYDSLGTDSGLPKDIGHLFFVVDSVTEKRDIDRNRKFYWTNIVQIFSSWLNKKKLMQTNLANWVFISYATRLTSISIRIWLISYVKKVRFLFKVCWRTWRWQICALLIHYSWFKGNQNFIVTAEAFS